MSTNVSGSSSKPKAVAEPIELPEGPLGEVFRALGFVDTQQLDQFMQAALGPSNLPRALARAPSRRTIRRLVAALTDRIADIQTEWSGDPQLQAAATEVLRIAQRQHRPEPWDARSPAALVGSSWARPDGRRMQAILDRLSDMGLIVPEASIPGIVGVLARRGGTQPADPGNRSELAALLQQVLDGQDEPLASEAQSTDEMAQQLLTDPSLRPQTAAESVQLQLAGLMMDSGLAQSLGAVLDAWMQGGILMPILPRGRDVELSRVQTAALFGARGDLFSTLLAGPAVYNNLAEAVRLLVIAASLTAAHIVGNIGSSDAALPTPEGTQHSRLDKAQRSFQYSDRAAFVFSSLIGLSFLASGISQFLLEYNEAALGSLRFNIAGWADIAAGINTATAFLLAAFLADPRGSRHR